MSLILPRQEKPSWPPRSRPAVSVYNCISMEERNNLFPVFLKLEALDTLLVGGGNVGLEKLTALLKSSPAARVTVVAGIIRDEIKTMALENRTVHLIERDFR